MRTRSGSKYHGGGHGFTLVELLLVVALLVLLFSALLFNFSSLRPGASLEEGAAQFEGLLRFARAYSASSGRQVQIAFEEDDGDGFMVPLGNVRLLSEIDPISRPGEFEDLAEGQQYVEQVRDLISIEQVHPVDAGVMNLNGTNSIAMTSLNQGSSEDEEAMLATFAPITFYPDGTSDSAEIIVASRNGEDTRRFSIRIAGVIGMLKKRMITTNSVSSSQAETSADNPDDFP